MNYMDLKAAGGFAFPTELNGQDGMTLRDYFAGQALIGLLASVDSETWPLGCNPESSIQELHLSWAKMSYLFADAMLAARKQQHKDG